MAGMISWAGTMGKLGTLWQVGQTFGMRDGMLRFEYELQRSSGVLSRRMRPLSGWHSWDLKRIAPQTSAEGLLTVRRLGGHPFFFSDSRAMASDTTKVLGADGVESLLAEANGILE